MNHRIRVATSDDIPYLARLRYEFRSTLAPATEEGTDFVERCRSWMSERLGDGRWFCWVAEDETGLVGNVWVQLVEKMPAPTGEPEKHAYLTNFFVLDASRGRGIGSELLSRLLAWSATRKVHAVFLWPTTRTRALYERHGFLADGDAMQLLFVPRAQ